MGHRGVKKSDGVKQSAIGIGREEIEDYLKTTSDERNEVQFVQRTMADIVENVKREKSGIGPMPKPEHKAASTLSLDNSLTINKLYYPLKLNNFSVNDAKQSSAPFDIETIALEDRQWQCRQLTAQIAQAIEQKNKLACFVSAPKGMGKTVFLGDIYAQLDKRFVDILILSPSCNQSSPFASMIELIEQRFYLSPALPQALRLQYLTEAMASILPKDEKSQEISKQIEEFYALYSAGETEQKARPSDDKVELQRYLEAFLHVWEADLLKNRIVLIFDDAHLMDTASLQLISSIYHHLTDTALCLLLSVPEDYVYPEFLHRCAPMLFRLPSLSDAELEHFAYYLLQQLSGNREKLIIPPDLCKLIAQKSFGSPRRAQEITAKYFHPADILHWNESIDRVKELRAPDNFEEELNKKIDRLSSAERTCLLHAAPIAQRFNADTLEALNTESRHPVAHHSDMWSIGRGKRHYSQLLHALKEKGFLIAPVERIWGGPREYCFKREAERAVIVRNLDEDEKIRIHLACAKWYALHNQNANFTEAVAEHWRRGGNARLASQYYQASADSARLEGRFPKAILLYKKSILTLSHESPALLIAMHLNLAWCSHKLGNVEDAYRHNLFAFQTALKHSAFASASHAMAQASHVLLDLGAYKKARKLFGRARALLNREENPLVLAIVLEGMARYYYLKHLTLKAKSCVDASQTLRLAQSPPLETTPTLHMQSLIALQDNDIKGALQLLQECLDARHARNDLIGMGESYRILAMIHYRSQNTAKALEQWNKALGIAQEVGDVTLLAQLLNEIAEGAIHMNALKTGFDALTQSMGLAKRAKNKHLISMCLKTQAELLLAHKQCDKAYHSIRKSLKVARKLGNYQLIGENLTLFASLFALPDHELHSHPKADRYFTAAIKLFEKKNLRICLAKALPLYANFLLDNHQNIAALLLYKRSRDIYTQLDLKKAAESINIIVEQLEGTRPPDGSVV